MVNNTAKFFLIPFVAIQLILVGCSPINLGKVIYIPPLCDFDCPTPNVNGVVDPSEYYGGAKVPMQDYGLGGPNGEMYLAVKFSRLHMGIRVPKPVFANSEDGGGSLTLYLDALRKHTLAINPNPNALQPRDEDRRLIIRYKLTSQGIQSGLSQTQGAPGSWIPVTTEGWATDYKLSIPGDDPDFLHIEVGVEMKTAAQTVSEPLESDMVGLGVLHSGDDGSWQDLPNGMNAAPVSDSTKTWKTLYFHIPDGIPLKMATYNIGQMADWMIVGDGGAGDIGPEGVVWDPMDSGESEFARYIWDKDVVCINEAWSDPDRTKLVGAVQKWRVANNLEPMSVAGIDWGDGDDVGYTGLLIFSSRPFAEPPQYLEYDTDLCSGFDCCVEKGAIWARVLIEGGTPPEDSPGQGPFAGPPPSLVGNADHFVDVFCTHLQADDESVLPAALPTCAPVPVPHAEEYVRSQQLAELREFIDKKRAPDRPAFVMGDLNIRGGEAEHPGLMQTLLEGLPQDFDKNVIWLNHIYDLGQVNAPPIGTYISGGDCTPGIYTEINANARYDYIIQIPPANEWPDWGVAAEPVVSVDPHYDITVSEDECLSDHAMLMAEVELIKTTQPGKWNMKKDHAVSFEIFELVDRDPSGCCADWYTNDFKIGDQSKSYSDDDTLDGAPVGMPMNPGWVVSKTLSGFEEVDMEVEVWEWDASPGDNDHYDCSEHGRDPEFRFNHGNGQWYELDWHCLQWDNTSIFSQCLNSVYYVYPIGNFDDCPEGMIYRTKGEGSENYGDAGEKLKAEELQ